MSQAEFDAAQNRINQSRLAHAQGQNQGPPTSGEPTQQTPEKELHNAIIKHLNEKRILFFHGSTAHRTHYTLGTPDFIVALSQGRTLWVECKTRTGKLSEEQTIVKHRLEAAGHAYYIVRSIREFYALIPE